MAERPKGYGMTAELANKQAAKYDMQSATEARDWITAIVPDAAIGEPTADNLHVALKDGEVLCKLINAIKPGSVKKINTSKMAFKQMENIGNFLQACEAIGVVRTDLFQTVDLYEKQNMAQVVNGIHAIGRKVQTIGWDGPSLGPKEATGQKREFTEEQLRAGKNVIGLQMGTNKGASQAGATPYGLGRQIEKTNLKN